MDPRHESPSSSLLLLAQVDHACGDIIASAMEQLSAAGAKNVHLVPSLTKKGRPGYLLFVDVPASCLAEVEWLLAAELGVLGWRIMAGEHRGPEVEARVVDVTLRLGSADTVLAVPVKLVRNASTGAYAVHVEHDYCVRMKRELQETRGIDISLRVLKARVQSAVADALDRTSE